MRRSWFRLLLELESFFRNSICDPAAIKAVEKVINFLLGFSVDWLKFLQILLKLFECNLMLSLALSQLSDLVTGSFVASYKLVELLVWDSEN